MKRPGLTADFYEGVHDPIEVACLTAFSMHPWKSSAITIPFAYEEQDELRDDTFAQLYFAHQGIAAKLIREQFQEGIAEDIERLLALSLAKNYEGSKRQRNRDAVEALHEAAYSLNDRMVGIVTSLEEQHRKIMTLDALMYPKLFSRPEDYLIVVRDEFRDRKIAPLLRRFV